MSPLLLSPWLVTGLHVVTVIGLGALVTIAGGAVVQGVFRRVDARSRRDHEDAQPATTDGGVVAAGQQLRGGAWIGALERLAIFAGLIAHYPEAIAICLAMKGLARYPELKATTTGAAERFIIGTFVSVLLACGAAGLALWLNGLY
ncbi:hypothetical protein [Luteococcus sp. OSA5]|uniref:hypothetical protein n=1 Tax=Luteococcus sp. OSA5 TaxID=3401630 RepID=UPI003B4293E2